MIKIVSKLPCRGGRGTGADAAVWRASWRTSSLTSSSSTPSSSPPNWSTSSSCCCSWFSKLLINCRTSERDGIRGTKSLPSPPPPSVPSGSPAGTVSSLEQIICYVYRQNPWTSMILGWKCTSLGQSQHLLERKYELWLVKRCTLEFQIEDTARKNLTRFKKSIRTVVQVFI